MSSMKPKTSDLRKEIARLQTKVGNLTMESKSNVNTTYVTGAPTPGNTVALTSLVPIAEGDTFDSRTGRSIIAKHLRYGATVTTSSTSIRDTGRFMIIRWKPALAGANPAAADILFNVTNVNTPLVPWNRKDYVVLVDKTFTVSSFEPTLLEYDLKLNYEATYSTSASSGHNENTLFALIVMAENTSPSTFNYYSQFSFIP
jgi:hypothetical protein